MIETRLATTSKARTIAKAALIAVPLLLAVFLSALANLSKGKALPLPLASIVGPARMSELRFAFAAEGGKVSNGLADRAKRSLAAMPLASDPFLLVALRDFPTPTSLGTARAEPLLAHVIKRNPRSRGANLMLFKRRVAEGKIAPTLQQLATLRRLEPDMVDGLLQKLGQQVTTPAIARELAMVLRSRPELFGGAALGIASSPASGDVVATFVEHSQTNQLRQSPSSPALVDRLLREGRVYQARRVWALGEPAASSRALIQDPTFARTTTHPPFGWTYSQSSVGLSERQDGGGAYIESFGRRGGELLSQILTLGAGGYRAAVDFSDAAGQASVLGIVIECFGGARKLAERRFDAAPGGSGQLVVAFDVPVGCPAQKLAIVGSVSDGRQGQSLTVRSINVAKTGR